MVNQETPNNFRTSVTLWRFPVNNLFEGDAAARCEPGYHAFTE
jgi:hypothetical protein